MRLRTGDLVLFAARRSAWSALEWLLSARITHVGLVLVNPPFENVPTGAYLWHVPAGAARVRLTRLDSVDVSGSHVLVRRCARPPDAHALQQVHHESRTALGAFVALALTRLGWLADTTDCTAVTPADLASASTALTWTGERYGPDERVSPSEWAAMVARRVPLFDDHRACLAKAAAQSLEVRGAKVLHPVGTEANFAVEGRGGRAVVLVPASKENRGRYEAHMPLFYELERDGGRPIACTEAELLALAL
jgi:hypothetical protein